METLFINDVEFELVPVYEYSEGQAGKSYLVPFNPYGNSKIHGYMLKPLSRKPLNSLKEAK